ncbi:predicted protein [Streptomyces filamentosus NRRL 15998]|uniref:Predicted protein n=1 Tax=Streptomyces filamentosus NRRL 15998 TaxID=457431 RepID=D6AB69_STRFL|nr:predicted protein [Streptomyces filamentosus NRRL 15998]
MDYGKHQTPQGYEPGEGILTTLIRIPVRIVVLVLVLPARMVWDALTALWHAADRVLLRPLGRALLWLLDTLVLTPLTWLFTWVVAPLGKAAAWLAVALLIWPWIGLWRYVIVPVARYGIAAPAVWLYAHVLTPLGHGLRWIGTALLLPALYGLGNGIGWLITMALIVPLQFLWRYVAVPVVRYGLVVPVAWLYANVLTPIGLGTAWVLGTLWQGTAWALAQLWRGIAATGRGLGLAVAWLVMTLLVAPLGWGVPPDPHPARPGDRRRVRGRLADRRVRLPGRRPGPRMARVESDRRTGLLGVPHGVHPRRPLPARRGLGPGPARRRRSGPGRPGGPDHRPGNRASGASRRLAGPGRRPRRRTAWGTARDPCAYSG